MKGDLQSTELLSRNGKNRGCQMRAAMKQRCNMTTSVAAKLAVAQLTSRPENRCFGLAVPPTISITERGIDVDAREMKTRGFCVAPSGSVLCRVVALAIRATSNKNLRRWLGDSNSRWTGSRKALQPLLWLGRTSTTSHMS